jgi:hypothetical protein
MIGSIAEAWSYCISRSDGDLLRVWFGCGLFMPSDCDVKMVDTLKAGKNSFENIAKFRYLGTDLTIQNCITVENESKYHS